MGRRYLVWAAAAYFVVSLALAVWLLPAGREQPPLTFPEAHKPERQPVSGAVRDSLLRQARVWRQPHDAAHAIGDRAGRSEALSDPLPRCRYVDAPARGTTAKFDCVLRDGEVVKVKYGYSGELHAEVAASRLLAALGFGADRMYMIPRIRCYGCVRTPFYTMWVFDQLGLRTRFTRTIPEDSFTDFEWVAVERRFDAREIATDGDGGWAWYELDAIDGSKGANRAERDALRLAAMLLAHWDNKADNQRLVCASEAADAAGDERGRPGSCAEPFAFIHDLGATFGPRKLDLQDWQQAPIWADRARCLVSMRAFPYNGGTFQDARISEAGRRLFLEQLARLDDRWLANLFALARFPEYHGGRGPGADVNTWVRTLRDKARQIADAGPCE